MRDTALVIMAAGLGSRFGGGIKQLEPVGPNGEIIMDYSIHDALEAGFDKIVFIIRRDLEKDFKEIIGHRIEKLARVEYAYQELSDLPEGFSVPAGRTKPWGTGQAVLTVKGLVKEPFLVINADDYYGKEAFRKIHTYMVQEMDCDREVYDMCMAGFVLANTLSENGAVTRGACQVHADGTLKRVRETFAIQMLPEGLYGEDEKGVPVDLEPGQLVSMNMWGFSPAFLDELERLFPIFLRNIPEGDLKTEFLLPRVVDELVQAGRATVKVLDTQDKWFGVTYKEDKEAVVTAIRKLIAEGLYKEKLFS